MAEFSAQRNITQNNVKRITKSSRHDSFYGSTWLLGQQRVILIVLMEYQSLFSIIYISLFSILTGSHHPCSPYVFTNEDIKNNFYFSTSCTFRILFHQIVTLVSRTVRIFFHLTVTRISWALLGYSFIRKLHQYLVHFRIDSHSNFTSAFCAVLESSFIGLLRQYLARS